MFWFKHHNNFSTNPKVEMLIDYHKLNGYYGLVRMFEVFAEHLDDENPETFVFSKRKFYQEIFPFCCQKTKNKIMDYFQNLGWIKYRIYGKEILIQCQEMKKLSDDTQRKNAEKKPKERTEMSGQCPDTVSRFPSVSKFCLLGVSTYSRSNIIGSRAKDLF